MSRRYPVEVTWEDAYAGGGRWSVEDEHEEDDFVLLVKTYGTLIKNTDKHVKVAQNIDSQGLVREVMTIPKGMVRKIRRIKL